MPSDQYKKALKSGERKYHEHLLKGSYPYLPSLEEILPDMNQYATENLGIIQIPTELMVGTSTSARKNAFAPNFMPLLPADTEFAMKWIELCRAHEEEGIRDPIKAYEYMNHYFVTEGNKRVSVLKFFNAPILVGSVTRILPPKDDSYANRLYYEYLDFNRLSGVNYLTLSRLGDYRLLLARLHKAADQEWSEDERLDFRAFYFRFRDAFSSLGGKKLPITPGDAILVYLKIYQDYEQEKNKLSDPLKKSLERIWDDILLRCQNNDATMLMQPSEDPKRSFLDRLLPASSPRMKVAFLYDNTPQTSHWTYSHELGRLYLEQAFGDQIITTAYDNLTVDTVGAAIEKAIADGNTTIFTTAAEFIEPSLIAAIDHPDVRILNCSLNCSHRYIRTYYGRMYEAMFLTGAIAGSASQEGRIGYIAAYPTYGSIAEINAFALGAKMINPRAIVDLQWYPVGGWDPQAFYASHETVFISGPAVAEPGKAPNPFGLYSIQNGELTDIALPMWHWGRFYELLLRSTLSGAWKHDDPAGSFKALNYWWGLSSGIVDVVYSRKISPDTEKLIHLLRQSLSNGSFHPFSGILRSQNGIVQSDPQATLSPVEIITMDWLNENVRGHIPSLEELDPATRPLVRLQGIGTQEQQWHRQEGL